MSKFTNIHTHIFNSECAPENFLRILPVGMVRRFPGTIKRMLESRRLRSYVGRTNQRLNNGRRRYKGIVFTLARYMSFLNVGLQNSQLQIFNMAARPARTIDPGSRIVALTLNMDYMDNQGKPPQTSFATQVEEVKQIKRSYPSTFFPFLSADPRHHSGIDLKNWAQKHFEKGIFDQETAQYYPYFAGIKIYPALGFFPFDKRLDELWAYAEQMGLPVMTHCTRVGSMYVGSSIESLIPKDLNLIKMDVPNSPNSDKAYTEIAARIKRFYDKKWIKNSQIGGNDYACDLFGHPQNYIPVMEKYPKLKICLAHMGGSSEMHDNPKRKLRKLQDVDEHRWAELTREMMMEYPNMFTDISYTLADLNEDHVKQYIIDWMETHFQNDENLPKLADRVMFGTDFYMTEQEATEERLYSRMRDNLGQYYHSLTVEAPKKYLGY